MPESIDKKWWKAPLIQLEIVAYKDCTFLQTDVCSFDGEPWQIVSEVEGVDDSMLLVGRTAP